MISLYLHYFTCLLLITIGNGGAQDGDILNDIPIALARFFEHDQQVDIGTLQVCNWKNIEYDSLNSVMVTVQGEASDLPEDLFDVMIEGSLCDETADVFLLFDDSGMRGSIHKAEGVDMTITALSLEQSVITVTELPMDTHEDTESTKYVADKYMETLKQLEGYRRNLADTPAPASQEINMHIEIAAEMAEEFAGLHSIEHGEFQAVKYALELIQVVNEDIFHDIGFDLKVRSVNVQTESIDCYPGCNPYDYLEHLKETTVDRDNGIHLNYLFTSSRDLGGIAYSDGLYNPTFGYGVCGSLSQGFSIRDRNVVAHEIGHNMGAIHTHDMTNPPDTCGDRDDAGSVESCSPISPEEGAPKGTIMSYCKLCEGGTGNIVLEWHERNLDLIYTQYELHGHTLAPYTGGVSCGALPDLPTDGMPFYMELENCLEVDMSACDECSSFDSCSEDSLWQYDSGRKQMRLANGLFEYCWTAADDCSTIALAECWYLEFEGGTVYREDSFETPDVQKFSVTDDGFVNEKCGLVKASEDKLGFLGTAVKSWCEGSVDAHDSHYECPGIIDVGCGDVITGRTNGDCPVQQFKFTPSGEFGDHVNMTTCGSELDTLLTVKKDNKNIYSNDNPGGIYYYYHPEKSTRDCPASTSAILYDMKLAAGEEYDVILEGWCDTVGPWSLEVTCTEFKTPLPTNSPTSSPSQEPSKAPITSKPTLSPTSMPTPNPTDSPVDSSPSSDCMDSSSYCPIYYASYCNYGAFWQSYCPVTCNACPEAEMALGTAVHLQKETLLGDSAARESETVISSYSYSVAKYGLAIIGCLGSINVILQLCRKSSSYSSVNDMDDI